VPERTGHIAHAGECAECGIITAAGTSAQRRGYCLTHPGHPLRPVAHLAMVCGLASSQADTRIAAASLWSQACADGRLDPDLAAAALRAVARSEAVKLSRIADALGRAAHEPLLGWRIVQTVCAAAGVLTGTSMALAPPGAHQLLELAARLGAEVGVPPIPGAFADLAGRAAAWPSTPDGSASSPTARTQHGPRPPPTRSARSYAGPRRPGPSTEKAF